MKDEPPHFMKANEDCMGNPTAPYWRQFLDCSDGRVVLGAGNTPEEAAENASKRRTEHEHFLSMTPEGQIRQILGKGEDYPGGQDQGTLNRAFAKLLGVI